MRALTRHPKKPVSQQLAQAGAEIILGDLNDAASLERAIEGVDGVYIMLASQEHGPEVELQQGKLIGDLARQANVAHVVYSSAGGADRQSPLPHIQSKWLIEQYLRQLQFPLTAAEASSYSLLLDRLCYYLPDIFNLKKPGRVGNVFDKSGSCSYYNTC